MVVVVKVYSRRQHACAKEVFCERMLGFHNKVLLFLLIVQDFKLKPMHVNKRACITQCGTST